ncbi:MAG: hypothetical protein APF80_09800 [Alphaproteobacteria bacterium BRH_c36]|nr:MAG: hypothetical protein APF80_09800 [Alphaproteobacteria bacterium BRH_c36]
MTLHLVKLCVGAQSIEDLAQWQAARLAEARQGGGGPRQLFHTTYQAPKRTEELLDGGSIYWVIKGVIQVRQRLIGFDEGAKDDGRRCCLLLLDPDLVPVRPTPRRAFQGWRYLTGEDAPPDLSGGAGTGMAGMPPRMRRELAELGLL